MMQKSTLYEILGIAPQASTQDIQQAYQEAMRQLQQSASPDLIRRTMLQDALHVLSNPNRRAQYDNSLTLPITRSVQPRKRSMNSFYWVLVLLLAGFVGHKVVIKSQDTMEVQQRVIPQSTIKYAVIPVNETRSISPALSSTDLYRILAPSQATIRLLDQQGNLLGTGSGVSIGDGLIITNCHVAQSGSQLRVHNLSGTYDAYINVADKTDDLCSLRVQGPTGPVVTIRGSQSLMVGEHVYAIGSPHGLDLTLSEGIISALRKMQDGGVLIQTNAAISPGSSGGGLFDEHGRLIGITTFQEKRVTDLNFAVAADLIPNLRNQNVSDRSIGSLTLGSNAAVMGHWACLDPVGGQTLDFYFEANQQMVIDTHDHRGSAMYQFHDGILSFRSATSGINGQVTELNDQHMILIFKDKSLSCGRS